MLSATHGQSSVLVVDDEPLVRMFTAMGLREAGFVVVEACNAEEALAEFDARTVLAVITDIEMPGPMNGYDLAWRVRELQPCIPLVIISGRVVPQASELPPKARFLGKPVVPETLLAELRHAIDASREG
jgi:CheY-like chemotaxis protein